MADLLYSAGASWLARFPVLYPVGHVVLEDGVLDVAEGLGVGPYLAPPLGDDGLDLGKQFADVGHDLSPQLVQQP